MYTFHFVNEKEVNFSLVQMKLLNPVKKGKRKKERNSVTLYEMNDLKF